MKKNFLTLFALFIAFAAFSQQMASGYVFDDTDKNGRKDRREAGISGVAVSNGIEVTVTNDKGFYTLPVGDDNTIFVIKPSGYQVPVDEHFVPKYYYHHKPNGSPESFTYKGVTATGKTLKEARANAYEATEWVNFDNKYMRHDIGKAIDEV